MPDGALEMAGEGNGERDRMSRETVREVGALGARMDAIRDRQAEHIEDTRREIEKVHDRITKHDEKMAARIETIVDEHEALRAAVISLRDSANQERGARRAFRAIWHLVSAGAGGLLAVLGVNWSDIVGKH